MEQDSPGGRERQEEDVLDGRGRVNKKPGPEGKALGEVAYRDDGRRNFI